MSDLELECIVWCPKCRKDKYEVQRKPVGRTGVYENVIQNISDNKDLLKVCADCGDTLERKPL